MHIWIINHSTHFFWALCLMCENPPTTCYRIMFDNLFQTFIYFEKMIFLIMNDLLELLVSFDLSHLLEFLSANKIFCLRDLLNIQDSLFGLGEFTNDDLIKLHELLEYARKFDYRNIGNTMNSDNREKNKNTFFSRFFRKSKSTRKAGESNITPDEKHLNMAKIVSHTQSISKNTNRSALTGSMGLKNEMEREYCLNQGEKMRDPPKAEANSRIRCNTLTAISDPQSDLENTCTKTSYKNLELQASDAKDLVAIACVKDNYKAELDSAIDIEDNRDSENSESRFSDETLGKISQKSTVFSNVETAYEKNKAFCSDLKSVIDKKGAKKYFFGALKSFISGKNKDSAPIKEKIDYYQRLSIGKSNNTVEQSYSNQNETTVRFIDELLDTKKDTNIDYKTKRGNISANQMHVKKSPRVSEGGISSFKTSLCAIPSDGIQNQQEVAIIEGPNSSEAFKSQKMLGNTEIVKSLAQKSSIANSKDFCNKNSTVKDSNAQKNSPSFGVAKLTVFKNERFEKVNDESVKYEKIPIFANRESSHKNQNIKIVDYIELECSNPKYGFNTIKNTDGTTIIESVDYFEDSTASCVENIGKPHQIQVLEENARVKSSYSSEKNTFSNDNKSKGHRKQSHSDIEKAETDSEFIEKMANQSYILDSDSFCDMLSELTISDHNIPTSPAKMTRCNTLKQESDDSLTFYNFDRQKIFSNRSQKHNCSDTQANFASCGNMSTKTNIKAFLKKQERWKSEEILLSRKYATKPDNASTKDSKEGKSLIYHNIKNPLQLSSAKASQSIRSDKEGSKLLKKSVNPKVSDCLVQNSHHNLQSKMLSRDKNKNHQNPAFKVKNKACLFKSPKNISNIRHLPLEAPVSNKDSNVFNRSRQKKDASYIRRIFSKSVRASVETTSDIKTNVFDFQDEVCNVSSPHRKLLSPRLKSDSKMVERDNNLTCTHENDTNSNQCRKCTINPPIDSESMGKTTLNDRKDILCSKGMSTDDSDFKKPTLKSKLKIPKHVQALVSSRNGNKFLEKQNNQSVNYDTDIIHARITPNNTSDSDFMGKQAKNNAISPLSKQEFDKNKDRYENESIGQEEVQSSVNFETDHNDACKTISVSKTHELCNKNPLNHNSLIVCVRKRPVTKKDIIEIQEGCLCVNEIKTSVDLNKYIERKTFHYDHVFDADVKNEEIFDVIKDVVPHVLNHGSGCVLAYGQTGTGKTHTMFHPINGLVFLTLEKWLTYKKSGFISFIEVYNSAVYDLLDFCEKIDIREKSNVFYYTKIVEKEFHSLEQATEIINSGMICRKKGSTSANNESSRSHAILKISTSKSNLSTSSNGLMLVDLAGSERAHDSKFGSPLTRQEGAEINKSLLILKECIRNEGLSYQPFRQSKLTQILRPALLGKSKTYMIATINPSPNCVEHTLNTLQYASRLKNSDMTASKKSRLFNVDLNPKKSAFETMDGTKLNQNSKDSEVAHFDPFVQKIAINNHEKSRLDPLIIKLHDQNKPSRYQKFKFDYKYKKLASSVEISEKTTLYRTEHRKIQAGLLNKKIEYLAKNIIRSSENNLDLKMLSKTCELLKFVDEKVYDMKFK